jgi:serine phosphatase RsbU (regulator of sigma subunit)
VLSKKKIEDLVRKLVYAHKRIEDSIHYAKTIQDAMLPDTSMLYDYFPDSFIFYKPKDVLSGDFYWFKNGKDSFFIAVADCTGHGIAGALMSMIGIEKLNSIAFESKNPAEILKHLDRNIKSALSQSTQYAHSQNGMDIALCTINKGTNSMLFSGAKRPLWIIRKGQTEIEEINGSKKTIGGVVTDMNPDFELNEIQFEIGDSFYLFSDGYVDQFRAGGDKKITTKRLKELLLSIQHKTMSEQKDEIVQYFDDWKAGSEQIDDILVIGVRF